MNTHKYKVKQTGAVLFISLIILLIMTLLGISGMQTTILEEKMAGNYRDSNKAFQSTESALRQHEAWVNSRTTEPSSNNTGSNSVWNLNSMDPDDSNNIRWWKERDGAWWNTNGLDYGADLTGIQTRSRTVIEYKTFKSDTLLTGTGYTSTGLTFYQVTSRGTGGTDQSTVLLQSITARRY